MHTANGLVDAGVKLDQIDVLWVRRLIKWVVARDDRIAAVVLWCLDLEVYDGVLEVPEFQK
jgi:hypothetical protein